MGGGGVGELSIIEKTLFYDQIAHTYCCQGRGHYCIKMTPTPMLTFVRKNVIFLIIVSIPLDSVGSPLN